MKNYDIITKYKKDIHIYTMNMDNHKSLTLGLLLLSLDYY